jgi:hypothetical protein
MPGDTEVIHTSVGPPLSLISVTADLNHSSDVASSQASMHLELSSNHGSMVWMLWKTLECYPELPSNCLLGFHLVRV